MDLGLLDRSVLVTASSQGLGRACAEAFAQEGARLALCARRTVLLEETARDLLAMGARDVLTVTADLDREDDRSRLFHAIEDRFGGLDIAVVNAGNPVGGWVANVDDAAWEDAFRKWRAVCEIGRWAATSMATRGGGAVIHILSRTAVQPDRNLALSSMVRAALAAWTKMLADEVGPDGVRVLSVLPGLTRTAHIEESLLAREKRAGSADPTPNLEDLAARAAQREGVPLGRLGTPESLGRLVAFLASPVCDYVSGSLVRFDGGAIRTP